MMKRSVLAVVFAGAFVGVSQASEQDACGCVVAPNASGAGSIVSSTGDVFMSSTKGFEAVSTGQIIPQDAEIIVGCKAAAQIKVGQACNMQLSGGSQVQIVASGSQLCVRAKQASQDCGGGSVDGSGALSSAKSQTNGGTGFGLPEGIFVGTAGIWGIAAAAEGSDNPPPPASP